MKVRARFCEAERGGVGRGEVERRVSCCREKGGIDWELAAGGKAVDK